MTEIVIKDEVIEVATIAEQGPPGIGIKGDKGDTGDQGEPGALGSDANYIHTQYLVDDVWTITHNLGKMPSVTVVDSGDNTVIGEVHYIDANTVQVIFSAEFAGKAYLN